MQQLIVRGRVREYVVTIDGDDVFVTKAGHIIHWEYVPGLSGWLEKAVDVRIGWGKFQDDGDEVILISDRVDNYFGYAINLNDSNCSEWVLFDLIICVFPSA